MLLEGTAKSRDSITKYTGFVKLAILWPDMTPSLSEHVDLDLVPYPSRD